MHFHFKKILVQETRHECIETYDISKKTLLEKSVNKKEKKSNITSNSLFSELMLKVEIGNKIIKSQLN